jgi:predicted permease
LGYKLIIGPALVLLLYVGGLGLHGSATRITLFEAAMGPQIGGSIVAIQYGLNALLISLVVGVGTVLSFITLPLWWAVLQSVGPG